MRYESEMKTDLRRTKIYQASAEACSCWWAASTSNPIPSQNPSKIRIPSWKSLQKIPEPQERLLQQQHLKEEHHQERNLTTLGSQKGRHNPATTEAGKRLQRQIQQPSAPLQLKRERKRHTQIPKKELQNWEGNTWGEETSRTPF